MEWICFIIGLLAVCISIIAVVGHGIWVVTAWLLRQIFASSNSRPESRASPRATSGAISDLALRRQLNDWYRSGQINEATYRHLTGLLDSPRSPAPAPSSSKPTVQVHARPGDVAEHTTAPPPSPVDQSTVSAPPESIASTPTDTSPESDPAVPADAPSARAGRTWSQLLAVFMEERNIRWGELVGGMLVLFCSVALVVSLWTHIEAVPLLQFFIFTAVTATLFGVGLYTEHRWRLPTTSRGLLTIATLLVPLNCLAIAAFASGALMHPALVITGEITALLVFAPLLYLAGRVIAPASAMGITLGVLAASAWSFVVPRAVDGETAMVTLNALAVLPWLALAAPTAVSVVRHQGRRLHRAAIYDILAALGLLGFAALAPMVLLVHQSGDTPATLQRLALLVSLFGVPPLAVGLTVWRHVERPVFATLRTIGFAVAILGSVILLIGLVLAWPDPPLLLTVAGSNTLILLAVALRLGIPSAHLPAAGYATLAYLIAFHGLFGQLEWQPVQDLQLVRILVGGWSGPALLAMVAALLAAAVLAHRYHRHEDRPWHLLAALIVGLLAAVLASVHSFARAGDPFGATWVYLALATTALASAYVLRRRWLTWLGLGLALLGFAQGVVFLFAEPMGLTVPWPVSLLSFATLAGVGAEAARHGGPRVRQVFERASRQAALGALWLAILPIIVALGLDRLSLLAGYALWAGALWLTMAWRWHSAALLTSGQVSLAAALYLAVTAQAVGRAWFDQAQSPLLHPWSIQAQAIALAMLSLAWTGVRIALHRDRHRRSVRRPARDRAHRLLAATDPGFDQLLAVALGALILIVAAIAALPGVAYELSSPMAGAPWLDHARDAALLRFADVGGWLWLALLAIIALAGCWYRYRDDRLLVLPVLALVGCLLMAARYADDGASASVLQWCLAGLFLAGSVAPHLRPLLRPLPQWLGWRRLDGELARPQLAHYTPLLLALTLPLLVILTLFATIFTGIGRETIGPATHVFPGRLGPGLVQTIPLVVVGLAMFSHAVRERRVAWFYGAAAFAHFAALVAYVHAHPAPRPETLGTWSVEHLLVHTIVAALWGMGALGLIAPVIVARIGRVIERGIHLQPPRIAAALALTGLWTAAGIALLSYGAPHPATFEAALVWPALGVVAALMIASLWYAAARYAGLGLYLLGLNAVVVAIVETRPPGPWLTWWLTFAAAVYVVATVMAWRTRAHWLDRLARCARWSIGPASVDAGVRWMATMTVTLNLGVLAAVYLLDLYFSLGEAATTGPAEPLPRLGLASVVLLAVLALGVLGDALSEGRGLRILTLLLAGIAGVAWGWAWLLPAGPVDDVLHRAVAAMVSLGAVSAVASVSLMRLAAEGVQQRWRDAVRAAMPGLIAAAAAALAVVLATEAWYQFDRGEVPMVPLAQWLVILTLIGCAAAALVFAAVPGRDPLGLSLRGRTAYVYGAELLIVLMLVHIRLTMPWLFTGFFERIWPLVVMAIAFIGVGLAAWFRRLKLPVLAEPLENTGALLPLLPVMAFWFVGAQVHYSALLVTVGLFYGLLSVLRRSFVLGLLAVLAANGAFWFLLHDTGRFAFHLHPQLWLIPPALSVLIAAQLNRQQLGDARLTAFRYGCLIVIYVSSTAEIFIAGVATSPWLPMVLAALSVLGVLAGIWLRVQSFLLLGAVFLLLSLVTMIWHATASLGWTWLWYLAGIVLGLAILILFALFEKQRQRVVHVVDDLRSWQR